jgi:hypothetical protein
MPNKAPVQTPSVFLDGGGSGLFSANCVKALLESGYKPEWFGSYDHVAKQISTARKKVDAYDDAWVKGKRPLPPAPSREDRYLARCQAGHLSQDATHRKQGGRDNCCANLQEGYATNLAPCMPVTQGPYSPRGSEHWVGTVDECEKSEKAQAENRRRGRRRDFYDARRRDADDDARTRKIVKHVEPRTDRRRPISKHTWERAKQGTKTINRSVPADRRVDGEDAAECINNFRRAAQKAMRAELIQQRIAQREQNRAYAASYPQKKGETRAERIERGRKQEGESDEDYKKRVAAGKKAAENDHKSAVQRTEKLEEKEAAAKAKVEQAAYKGPREYNAAQRDLAKVTAERKSAAREANQSKTAMSRACEAEEGDRLDKLAPEERAHMIEHGRTRKGNDAARAPSTDGQRRRLAGGR